MAHSRFTGVLVSACALTSVVSAASAATRVYDASAPVQSAKRGVAANFLNATDFTALNPGVSWWYNYASSPNGSVPGGVVPANAGLDFRPMIFDANPRNFTGLQNYLNTGARPKEILAINEPTISGQAVMTPAQAATVYKNTRAIADKYNIPVIGPLMPAGGNAGNPADTATFLSQFYQAAANNGTTVAGIGYHVYDNIGGFKANLNSAITLAGGRSLSVNEFAYYDAASDLEQRNYLIQAVDTMENNPKVTEYAWFKERTDNPPASPHISLLSAKPGVLTTIGDAYVNMPVHDADVYYRPNGRLQAERYTTMANAAIAATTDVGADSLADMTASAGNAQLNYNLFVENAGLYNVKLRVAGGAGLITLLDGTTTLGTALATAGGFQTLSTQIRLDAGYESLTLRLQRSGQTINYIEFAAVPEPSVAGLLLGLGAIATRSRRRPTRAASQSDR